MRLSLIITFMLILGASSIFGQPSKWQWASPTPQGNNLTRIAVADSESVFFCGGLSTIVHLNTKDDSWYVTSQAGNETTDLADIAFLHKSRGIAVGNTNGSRSVVLLTRDGGRHWEKQDINIVPQGSWQVVAFRTDGVPFVAGGNKIVASLDGGHTWYTEVITSKPFTCKSMVFTSKKIGYIVGLAPFILKKKD